VTTTSDRTTHVRRLPGTRYATTVTDVHSSITPSTVHANHGRAYSSSCTTTAATAKKYVTTRRIAAAVHSGLVASCSVVAIGFLRRSRHGPLVVEHVHGLRFDLVVVQQ
jgi:hypothetical protein